MAKKKRSYSPTPEELFWRHINPLDKLIEDKDHCWPYQGGVSDEGYGRITWMNQKFAAHRISYAIHYGPYLPWLCVLHRCDNRLCCRPEHLFLGTQADNINDMVAKGRHWEKQRTHCTQGHEYTPENTYMHPIRGRTCCECRRIKRRRRDAKKRAAKIITKLAQPIS